MVSSPHGQSASNINVKEWLGKHLSHATRDLLDKVIAGLKEKGVTEFAATGYCFGGESTRANEWECRGTLIRHRSLRL